MLQGRSGAPQRRSAASRCVAAGSWSRRRCSGLLALIQLEDVSKVSQIWSISLWRPGGLLQNAH